MCPRHRAGGARPSITHLRPQPKRAGQQRIAARDLILALGVGDDDSQIAGRRELVHHLPAAPARGAAILGHDRNRKVVAHALADGFSNRHALRAVGQSE